MARGGGAGGREAMFILEKIFDFDICRKSICTVVSGAADLEYRVARSQRTT